MESEGSQQCQQKPLLRCHVSSISHNITVWARKCAQPLRVRRPFF